MAKLDQKLWVLVNHIHDLDRHLYDTHLHHLDKKLGPMEQSCYQIVIRGSVSVETNIHIPERFGC